MVSVLHGSNAFLHDATFHLSLAFCIHIDVKSRVRSIVREHACGIVRRAVANWAAVGQAPCLRTFQALLLVNLSFFRNAAVFLGDFYIFRCSARYSTRCSARLVISKRRNGLQIFLLSLLISIARYLRSDEVVTVFLSRRHKVLS